MAILYGRGTRLFVTEHNSSVRLLRELYRLGDEGVPVRGMISALGALDRISIRALNCYLRFRRLHGVCVETTGMHRYSWYSLQTEVGLRWVN